MDTFLDVIHTAWHRDIYCLEVEKRFKKKFIFLHFFGIIDFKSHISRRQSNKTKYSFYQSIAYGVPYKYCFGDSWISCFLCFLKTFYEWVKNDPLGCKGLTWKTSVLRSSANGNWNRNTNDNLSRPWMCVIFLVFTA